MKKDVIKLLESFDFFNEEITATDEHYPPPGKGYEEVGEFNKFEKKCLAIFQQAQKEHLLFHEEDGVCSLGGDIDFQEHLKIVSRIRMSEYLMWASVHKRINHKANQLVITKGFKICKINESLFNPLEVTFLGVKPGEA